MLVRKLWNNLDNVLSWLNQTFTCVRLRLLIRYVAVIHTPSACTPVGPTMSNQIGSSFYSHQCGGGVFDLSSLGTKDLTYDSPRFLYWMRVCAFVNETRCASAQPSSFCQLGKSSTDTPVDVSDFNASVANLYTVTPVGLNIDLKSGESCQNMGLRQTTYHLVCNPKVRIAFQQPLLLWGL